jgi:hypothetical protein
MVRLDEETYQRMRLVAFEREMMLGTLGREVFHKTFGTAPASKTPPNTARSTRSKNRKNKKR